MRINIVIKQLGKKRNVTQEEFILNNTPKNVEALIRESVITCVNIYNSKKEEKPLDNSKIETMKEIGKIAFGIHYNNKQANLEEAIQVALQCFEDGLVRIFQNEEELTDLTENIDVKDGDLFTFIRLTMLSGSIF